MRLTHWYVHSAGALIDQAINKHIYMPPQVFFSSVLQKNKKTTTTKKNFFCHVPDTLCPENVGDAKVHDDIFITFLAAAPPLHPRVYGSVADYDCHVQYSWPKKKNKKKNLSQDCGNIVFLLILIFFYDFIADTFAFKRISL